MQNLPVLLLDIRLRDLLQLWDYRSCGAKPALTLRFSTLQEYCLTSRKECGNDGCDLMSFTGQIYMVVAGHFTQNVFYKQSAGAIFVSNFRCPKWKR